MHSSGDVYDAWRALNPAEHSVQSALRAGSSSSQAEASLGTLDGQAARARSPAGFPVGLHTDHKAQADASLRTARQ